MFFDESNQFFYDTCLKSQHFSKQSTFQGTVLAWQRFCLLMCGFICERQEVNTENYTQLNGAIQNIPKLKTAHGNTQNKEQLHSSKSGIPASGLISENKPYIHLKQLISFNTSGSQPGLAHSPLFNVPLSSLPPIFHSTVFFLSFYSHSFSIQFLLSSSHT